MKKQILLILLLCVTSLSIEAQVPSNNTCDHAISWFYFSSSTPGVAICPNTALYDTSGTFVTYGATPGFPYPYQFNCTGIASSTQYPSNDVWFKVPDSANIFLESMSFDSIAVSLWHGVCGNLQPLACHIAHSWATVHTGDYLGGSKYLQISSYNHTETDSFYFCMDLDYPAFISIYSDAGVLCMDHNANIQPASSASSTDGSISITINAGNPPYSILWSTGDTTATISNLAPGNYYLQIADSVGCVTHDTLNVTFGLSSEFERQPYLSEIVPNPATEIVSISFAVNSVTKNMRLWLVNSVGQRVIETNIARNQNLVSFDVSRLPNGIYFLQSPDGIIRNTQRIIVSR